MTNLTRDAKHELFSALCKLIQSFFEISFNIFYYLNARPIHDYYSSLKISFLLSFRGYLEDQCVYNLLRCAERARLSRHGWFHFMTFFILLKLILQNFTFLFIYLIVVQKKFRYNFTTLYPPEKEHADVFRRR